MQRPDEGLIHTWLDGELDAAEAARVEALVRDDPEWAAAAAEARGLIAASARIVGALDHVPANVIPKTASGSSASNVGDTSIAGGIGPASRRIPWWTMRVAALLVVAVGTALVVSRSPDDLATPGSEMKSASADAGAATALAQPNASGTVGAAGQELERAEPARQLADDRAAAAKLKDSPQSPTAPTATSGDRAAPEPQTRNEADALGRTANAPQPSAAMGLRVAPTVAMSGAAAPARDESRRDRMAADQRVASMMLADSAAKVEAVTAAVAGAEQKKPAEAANVAKTVLGGAAGSAASSSAGRADAAAERIQEITTSPIQECFRETPVNTAGPATIHRVDRTSDSTARFAAAAGVSSQSRSLRENTAAPQMTVRGDTLVLGTAPDGRRRIALRITCPLP